MGAPAGALRDREGAAEAAETTSDSKDQEECMLAQYTTLLEENTSTYLWAEP
jgi:hypothetical protein